MRMIFLLLLMLGGCATAPAGRQFANVAWRAADINGVPVSPNAPITMEVQGGGQVSGSAGCNRYSGTYRWLSKEGIKFSTISTTRMACPDDVMDQERRFLSILAAVEGYSFYSDGGLSLISPDGRAIRFRR